MYNIIQSSKPIFKNINSIFDYHTNITIDKSFVLRVLTYVQDFINKDENSIQFFGSPLIGVFPVKWVNNDRNTWINEILRIELQEFDEITTAIHELPNINKAWKVSSDPINISCLWITHQALISTVLNAKEKEALARVALNILQYKMLSSIHTHYFPHPANIGIAMAVYESLDNKFQLKRAGSWQGLVQMRTDEILGHDALHAKTIRTLETDLEIVKMLNDIESRIKSIFNIITKRFHQFKEEQAKIMASNKFMTVDGEAILKDFNTGYNLIRTTMDSIVPDQNNFIKEEVMQAVLLTVNTVYPTYLHDTLVFISENFMVKKHNISIRDMVDEILMFSFDIIRKEKINLNDLTTVGIKMRGILRSSRLLSPEYKKIKNAMTDVIEMANPQINELAIPSTRVGVFLYILLRALLTQK